MKSGSTKKIAPLKVADLHIYDWNGWTRWTPLLELDIREVPDTPGAYVLATDHKICRAIGTDTVGILDIGETGKGPTGILSIRLDRLRSCATVRGQTGHMAGWRFAYFRFERHFPVASLRVRWVSAKTKEEARAFEGRMMLAYLMRHSELPPLNYQFNWQAFKEIGWEVFDDPACFGPPILPK